MLQKSHHSHAIDGSEVVEVNQIRITSNSDGTIRYVSISIQMQIKSIPMKSTVFIEFVNIISVGIKINIFLLKVLNARTNHAVFESIHVKWPLR